MAGSTSVRGWRHDLVLGPAGCWNVTAPCQTQEGLSAPSTWGWNSTAVCWEVSHGCNWVLQAATGLGLASPEPHSHAGLVVKIGAAQVLPYSPGGRSWHTLESKWAPGLLSAIPHARVKPGLAVTFLEKPRGPAGDTQVSGAVLMSCCHSILVIPVLSWQISSWICTYMCI